MGRVLTAVLAVTALAMALAPGASAQEQLAASCDPPRESQSNGWEYVAHSFSSAVSGPLTRAEIDILKTGAGGDYVVEIRTVAGPGEPTDTVLAAATVPDASVPTGDSFIVASFPNPANLVAGQDYALVVHRAAGLRVGYRVGDDCPGTAPFSHSGTTSSWVTFSGLDIVFRAFVTPPAVPQGALPRATCKGKPSTIAGTAGNDVLIGTPGPDVIAGLGGDDKIKSHGGDDLVCGGEGDDIIKGANGADRLFGDRGADRIFGGAGKDVIRGYKGDDKLFGGGNDDNIKGNRGADKIVGGGGNDVLAGNKGKDKLFGGGGNDLLKGGKGFDRCSGDRGKDKARACNR